MHGLTIYAFPFAGGDAYCYRKLRDALPASVSLRTLELPGRGRRSREPLLRDIGAMADDACGWMGTPVAPYVLFGHSMGALIAYEAARRLLDRGLPPPAHVIVAGRQAPHLPNGPRRWDLPGPEFREELRSLGACPDEVLNHRELMEYIEPVLRADFQAVDEYRARLRPPAALQLTVLTGEADDVGAPEAEAWQEVTSRKIEHARYSGGHFFLFDHAPAIASLLACPTR